MKPTRQLVVDRGHGDCLRACLCSILEIPNSRDLPATAGNPTWFSDWWSLLGRFGLALRYEREACWGTGYWIASVPSLNFDGVTHAIVMHGSEVAFDPSTRKTYAAGESLLGKDIVKGGWLLEVVDPSKFSGLVDLQRAAAVA